MGRPKRQNFAECGIDKTAWGALIESVHADCGSWGAVGAALPDLAGAERVSKAAARKWRERPTPELVRAACEYAAGRRLDPSAADDLGRGYWSGFHPTGKPGDYMSVLTGEAWPYEAGQNPTTDAEFEEALAIGAAYIAMDERRKRIVRDVVAELASAQGVGGLERSFEMLAINALAIRDMFADGEPSIEPDFLQDETGDCFQDGFKYLKGQNARRRDAERLKGTIAEGFMGGELRQTVQLMRECAYVCE